MKRNILIYGWFMWAIGALFYALDYFQHTAPSVLLEPISKSLNLNLVYVGDIMSVYFPLYAISQLPAGYFLDRFGTKKVLSISCTIVSLGLLLMGLSNGYLILLLGRILIAIGSGSAFIGALKIASDWLPAKLFPLAVGLTNTIGVLGGIFGVSFFAWLLDKLNWRTAVYIITAFGFLLAVFIIVLLKSKVSSKGEAVKRKNFSLKILKTLPLWCLALYAGIMVGTVVNAFAELYGVVFIEYNFHLSVEDGAAISSMIFVGIGCGGPVHGIIAGFLHSKKIWMLISNIITIVLFGILVLFSNFLVEWMLFIIYFGLGFFVSSMLLAFAVAREIYEPEQHGFVIAFINMFIGICGAIFQPLVGEIFLIVNGTSADNMINPHAFIVSFIFLLIPLIFSFFCCIAIKQKGAV